MRGKTLQGICIGIILSLCLAVIACAAAEEIKIWGGLESKPKTAETYQPEAVEIGIGGYKLFVLRSPAAGYTLAEREAAVYNRLVEALSMGRLVPAMITIKQVRSVPTIYVGPVRIVSVYPQDAKAAGKSQKKLAEIWRNRLAEVLPKLTVPPGPKPGVAGAVPGTYEVAVGGNLLFRLRGADHFPSLTERGQAVESQIVQMLSDGKYQPTKAVATALDGRWLVMFGGQPLVTATAEDAMANGTTPEQLAKMWAERINRALPRLKEPIAKAE